MAKKQEPLSVDEAMQITHYMFNTGVSQFKLGDLQVTFRDPLRVPPTVVTGAPADDKVRPSTGPVGQGGTTNP